MANEKNAINAEIDYLTKLIQKELSKPQKKIDINKVKEYQNRIIELENLKRTDEEQLQNIISTLKTRVETEKTQMPTQAFSKHRKIFTRVAVTALCVVFILFSAFSVTAIAVGGFDEAWVNISEFVSELLNLSPGTYEVDEVTLIKGNRSQRFDSIEDLLHKEGLTILYPTNLPENIKLEKITLIEIENDIRILFEFNRNDFTMAIRAIGKLIDDPNHLQIINTLECYIYQYDETYQATVYHENREYKIKCSNYEDLIFIIENLTYFN